MDIPASIEARSIVAHTPLEGQLGFRQMTGSEGLSQLFEFDVELIADNYNLDLDSLLGKPLTLEIETQSGSRYLNGQITRCELIGRENATSRYYIYKATVRPWLWYLTQTSDSKIFQKKNVPDVIKEVLGEYGFPFETALTGAYRNWEYCVQYQETDFAFISRLMEHEGIYYYFKHDNGQHTLVMTDDASSHDPMPGYEQIAYYGPDRLAKPSEEYISLWEVSAEITPDGYATTDYDFTKPSASLEAISRSPGGSQKGDLEIYEWQGGYQEPDHGEQYSKIRLQELQSNRKQNRGMSNARAIAPGHTFNLKNHPRSAENQEYLVVAATYRMSVGGYATAAGNEFQYESSFVSIPASQQYRAPRITPIPRTHGPQTARVVGPAGEEIWTDKYGRIKVQFHWDRYGQKSENSSCWVRVSSPWAGGGFGGLQLPRINDEVVIDFVGGCPDRPIVLGRVYNANNMPPVELPGGAPQSGFRSQSVHGDPSMCNMMIFDDKLGCEMFQMRAQRDMCAEIINDHSHLIGNNHCQTVGQNQDVNIGNDHCQVVGNNHNLQVGNNLQTTINAMEERLVKAEQKITINSNAIHDYHSNFDQTITGIETRVTNAEQSITVNSQAMHQYNADLDEVIAANRNVTVQANENKRVLGDIVEESNSYFKDVKSASITTVYGLKGTIVGGGNFSVYPLNAFFIGLGTTFSGVTANFQGLTRSFIGHEFEGKAAKQEAVAAEDRLIAMERDISGTKSGVSVLARSMKGVKSTQTGLKQEMAGLKNQANGLDNRVSTLESHA